MDATFFNVRKSRAVKFLTPSYIYVKLLVLFALFYALSFALGCFLFHLLEVKSSTMINSRINSYFSVSFLNCENVFDVSEKVIEISRADISHLIILFTAGFTMLASVAISLLLVYRGFALGFSISYFTFAIKNNLLTIGTSYTPIIVFSTISAVIAVIMIHVGVKTALFADEFKSLGGIPRKIIKSQAVYTQLLRFLIALGGIFILNSVRCFL